MEKQLVLSMRQAGAEEKQIAIEQGRSYYGIPAISVIVDVGWSKRSHKHSYNANLVWLSLLVKRPRSCSF